MEGNKMSSNTREQHFRKVFVDNEKKNPELTKILEKVNFDLLRKLLLDKAERSGIDPERFNFVGPDRISHYAGLQEYGTYNPETNIIGLDYERIKNICIRREGERFINLLILKLLIHESIHGVSKSRCIGFSDPKFSFQPQYSKRQSGYNQFLKYSEFDEGVTEKMATEVFEDYLENSNFTTEEERKTFRDFFARISGIVGYQKNIELINLVIEKISENFNQSQKVVWEAIMRGKFKGEEIGNEDIFTDTFGQNTMSRLAKLKDDEDIAGFMESIR